MGEITLDLRLVIKIPSSKLTIKGLVLGVKEGASQESKDWKVEILDTFGC